MMTHERHGRKIRVASLIGTLQVGGAESQLCEIVTRLNRERFEPFVYCLNEGGPLVEILERHDVPVTIANMPSSFRKFEAIRSLYAYFRKTRPDIVHGNLYHASLYGGIAAKFAGIPTLITHRKSLGYFKDGKIGYQFAENMLNLFTTTVLTNANAVRNDVLKREKISSKKVRVIYDGVDISKYAPSPNTPEQRMLRRRQKAAWGIAEHETVIGIVANLRPCKGYIEYVQAAAEVVKVFPVAKFLCIGEDRGMKAQLEQFATESGIAEHVIFTGGVANMPEMYRIIDILVSASYEEGFSNAILEGMACGKPIIATAVGGTPEQILDRQTGLLVPPRNAATLAQALIYLLEHPDIAAQFGAAARERAETHFTIEQAVKEFEALYAGFRSNKSGLSSPDA